MGGTRRRVLPVRCEPIVGSGRVPLIEGIGRILLGACGVAGTLFVLAWWLMMRMPGSSFHGVLPPLDAPTLGIRDALRRDVEALADDIGERNVARHDRLVRAANLIARALGEAGYAVSRHSFQVDGRTCDNLEVERTGAGRTSEIIVVGAHYDTVVGSPGADDNASGVAAMLALARAFSGVHPERTVRFLAFANEEGPYFATPGMGSWRYAQRCRQRSERIVAMLSLETMGYYNEAPGSQRYPAPFDRFYPPTGDFIGFVSNLSSRTLLHQVVAAFRRHGAHPSQGVASVEAIPGVSWSDQWGFWREGYPAIMVTDTAPYRYPHYHTSQDTPEKLHYDRLALVVRGLTAALLDLTSPSSRH